MRNRGWKARRANAVYGRKEAHFESQSCISFDFKMIGATYFATPPLDELQKQVHRVTAPLGTGRLIL